MKVQTLDKVIDDAGPPAIAVNAVEDVACGLHGQRGDFWALAVRRDGSDTGCDKQAYRFELAKFIHHGIYLLGIRSYGVEDRLGVIKNYEYLFGGKERSQGCKVLRVFNPCTNDLGEPGKEVSSRSRKLITADESTIVAKSFFDSMVVEDGQRNQSFPNPPCADESEGFEAFCEFDDFLNQFVTSETVPWRRGRQFAVGDAT